MVQHNSSTRVLFLGFAISEEMFSRVLATDRGMPAQTQRFGWSVIESLVEAGAEVVPLCVEPVADYPNNSRIMIAGKTFEHNGVRGQSVSFVNLLGLKHITRYASMRRAARQTADRDQPHAIVIHGVHSPLLWVGVGLGARMGIPVVTLLTDAPSLQTPYDNRASVALKHLDRALIRRALARMDGVVTLAPALADDFAPGRPTLWMEGIAPHVEPASGRNLSALPRTVVYAGGLHAAYGVLDLLAAVGRSRGSWRLVLYGRGPVEPQVRLAASQSSRIDFGGRVDPDALAGIYANADLLVNPRPPDAELARYSFPSKLMEYLSSGTPVLTTRLPNLPTDYEPNLFISEAGAGEMARSIDSLMEADQGPLRAVGLSARSFIRATRGPEAQGRRLVEFIGSLTR